ncbi:hypothetical protein STTU_3899 [Streptomyces sp. Tu6071]|nr:hypothetical protein STTU_3899 [Streptomyces sp. Tu6071]
MSDDRRAKRPGTAPGPVRHPGAGAGAEAADRAPALSRPRPRPALPRPLVGHAPRPVHPGGARGVPRTPRPGAGRTPPGLSAPGRPAGATAGCVIVAIP